MSEAAVLDFNSMAAPEIPAAPPVETPATPPEEVTPETDSTLIPEAPEQETPETPEQPPEAPNLKAIRDAVKAFSEAAPEHATAIKNMLSDAMRYKAFTETFPDVDTARSVKAAIEAIGGLEGLNELTGLRESVDETDSMIERGDPEVIERIFSDAKEGPVKLLPHYMNRVEKENPQAFGEVVRPHLVRSLEAANFDGALAGLAKLVADKPEALEIVKSMAEWKANEKRNAERTNLDTLEPERKKLAEQATQLGERERKQYEAELSRAVEPHMKAEFAKYLKPYEASINALPEKLQQAVARAWLEQIGKAFGESYHKQIDLMLRAKNRDIGKISNYAKTRMSAIAKQVSDAIVKDYKLTPGKGTAKPGVKPGQKPPVDTTVLRVKEKPADDQIDWQKTEDLMFITGKAVLKNGRTVKWR